MNTILFFVSDHGYGHIMRNVPVISELIDRGNKVVLVTGSVQNRLALQYISDKSGAVGESFIQIDMHTDAGLIVKPGTLVVDEKATEKEVGNYVKEFPDRINTGRELISRYKADGVVVDIVPWALTAAKEMGIPSYFMASFTWIEQYERFMHKDILSVLERSFGDADSVLMYELANEPTIRRYGRSPGRYDVGFVARPFHDDAVRDIRAEHNRPIVYISLGGSNMGLDFDIDVRGLPYDFIVTSVVRAVGDNVTVLPDEAVNTQDYALAADCCISKAGWSSVAELMLAGARTALLLRPGVAEDMFTINELGSRNEAVAITVDELRDMGSLMKKLEHAALKKPGYINGYMKAADIISG